MLPQVTGRGGVRTAGPRLPICSRAQPLTSPTTEAMSSPEQPWVCKADGNYGSFWSQRGGWGRGGVTYLAFGGREGFILLLPFTAQDPGRLPPWPLHWRIELRHLSVPFLQCRPGRWENGGVPAGRGGMLP